MYRWFPHGSKKLEHLESYGITTEEATWFRLNTTVPMVCHDQEPLNFDLYDHNCVAQYLSNRTKGKLSINDPGVQLMAQQHLKGIFFFNGYDQAVLLHSERNSNQLQKYLDIGFVGAYYWSHALIARDWYRYAQHDHRLHNRGFIKHFLVQNRAWSGSREYRLKFAELVLDHELLPHCEMKFSPLDQNQHYTKHTFVNNTLSISRQDLDAVFDLNTASSSSSGDYDQTAYSQNRIEVVLETLFDDHRQHLTEKILRPIACGKPFILAATPFSLQYLRDYGFQTFSPWIDETYDVILDPLDRLLAIVKEMRRIAKLSTGELSSMQAAIDQIAAYNQAKFFSAGWFDHVLGELKTNLDQARCTVENGPLGSNWNLIGNKLHLMPDMAKFYNKAWPGRRTQEQMDYYLDWINGRIKPDLNRLALTI